MKTLRTSGLEQLEPRAMLASFGPSGGHFESHFASPLPRFGDFTREERTHAPAEFASYGFRGPAGFDFRPPPLVIQIVFIAPPSVAQQISFPQIFSAIAGASSFDGEGEAPLPQVRSTAPGVSSSVLVSSGVFVSSRVLAAGLTSDLATTPLTQLAESADARAGFDTARRDDAAEERPALTSSRVAVERKLPSLVRRSTATTASDDEELIELDVVPSHGTRKSVSDSRTLESEHTSLPRLDVPAWPLLGRVMPAFRPSEVAPADDGLIELLAADIGSAVSAAGERPPASPAVIPAVTAVEAPALELATAADALPADEATPAVEPDAGP